MPVMPIYNCFHPVLKQKTKDIKEIDGNVKDLVEGMFATLYNISNGVGLAANQVGDLNSVIVIDLSASEEHKDSKPITMINPKIVGFSVQEDEDFEGCLSIPEFYEKVVRPAAIEIQYWDLDQKFHKHEAHGFLSRVMQHEVDHLNGILFFERLTSLRRAISKSKLKKIRKGDIPTNYPMVLPNGEIREAVTE